MNYKNNIVCGFNYPVLTEMLDEGYENRVDLVGTDPKYNIGVDYGEGIDDKLSLLNYLEETRKWINAGAKLLKPGGWFVVIINDENAPYYGVLLAIENLQWRNTVIWRYNFGENCNGKFSRCHAQVLFYAKRGKDAKFRGERLLIESDRQKMGDRRASPDGKMLPDVWHIPRVCGTHGEKISGVPNQLPEELCRRIVLSTTDPGDFGIDPHSGSGTFPFVLKREGRDWCGIDANKKKCEIARDRLKKLDYNPSLAKFARVA